MGIIYADGYKRFKRIEFWPQKSPLNAGFFEVNNNARISNLS